MKLISCHFVNMSLLFFSPNETGLPKVQYLYTSGKFEIRKGWQEGKLYHGKGMLGPFI